MTSEEQESSPSSSSFTFLPLGAIVQEFLVGSRNIVRGFPKEEHYRKLNAPYYGETIGRIANRVSGAKVELGGKEYKLSANEGRNQLHGGAEGWGKKMWKGPVPMDRGGREGVMFSFLSEHGDQVSVLSPSRLAWVCSLGQGTSRRPIGTIVIVVSIGLSRYGRG